MAKKEKNVTKTFTEEDYSVEAYGHIWSSKKEYKTVAQVLERFDEMEEGRRTSCPFPTLDAEGTQSNVSDNNTIGFGDWADRWRMDDKLWIMWHEYLSGRSNLKSPLTYANVEAFMAEFQEHVIGVLLSPTEAEDKNKVIIIKNIVKAWENRNNIQLVKNASFRGSSIKGTSITYNGYIRKTRKVEVVTTNISKDDLEGKEVEELEKINEELKKPKTEIKEVVDYDDVASIDVPLEEFYIDPNARCLRGTSYEAIDCVWRTTPSLEQCRAELNGSADPFIIKSNINKIKSVGDVSNADGGRPLFVVPDDLKGRTNQVEMIKYYNKQTGKYIIIVNDVILRNGPLPFNHLELPFARHRLIPLKDNFYGVGLAYILESLQLEDEVLRNLRLETLRVMLAPPIVYNQDIAEDIDSQWDMIEPNMKLGISGPVDDSTIRVLPGPTQNMEYYKMRETIREDSIIAAGVNPMAYSVPKAGEPVRNNLMSMESTMKMIKKSIRNWAEGEVESKRQQIALMRQYYPEKFVKSVDNKEEKSPTIRLDGVELVQDNTGEIQEKTIKGSSYFGIQGEHFELQGDIDVQIDMDTLTPMSRATQLQAINDAMTLFMPGFENPQLMENPAYIEFSKTYIELLGLVNKDQILAAYPDEDSEEEEIDADTQFSYMQAACEDPMVAMRVDIAAEIAGKPGESDRHKKRHVEQMSVLMARVIAMNKEMMKIQSALSNPNMTVQSLQEIQTVQLPKLQEDMDKDLKLIDYIQKHLIQDDVPKTGTIDAKMAEAKAVMGMMGGMPMQPPQGPQGANPMGQPMPPEQQMAQMGGGSAIPPMGI